MDQQLIRQCYKQWWTQYSIVVLLSLLILALSTALLVTNLLLWKKSGVQYYFWQSVFPAVVLTTLAVTLHVLCRHTHPKLALLMNNVALFTVCVATAKTATMAVQFTPFPCSDFLLMQWDSFMHYHAGNTTDAFLRHPRWHQIASFCYDSLAVELLLSPLMLSLICTERRCRNFWLMITITTLIGLSLYFFFPTTTPAHCYPFHHFQKKQYAVVAQFFEIQQHLKQSVHVGASVDLPSYHVIWLCCICYALRGHWLFVPVLVNNLIGCLATCLLGWHFLSSSLAGLLTFLIAALITHYISAANQRRHFALS